MNPIIPNLTLTEVMEERRRQEHNLRMQELESQQELVLNIDRHRPNATKRAYASKQLEFYVHIHLSGMEPRKRLPR